MKKGLLFIFIFLQSFIISAQLLNDSESKQLISKGLDKLYNLEFKEAEVFFSKVKSKYPNHPVTPLIAAMQLQWQNLPLEKNSKILAQYNKVLEKCQELAEKMLLDPAKKPEATFFLLAAHGFIALSYNYTKDYIKAGNEARKAYNYLADGFEFTEKNPEFLFTTGLYNFYRVQYPETHPITKPIMIFFEDGNKKMGLNQLEQATQKAIFTRIEAFYYLIGVYLKYESNPTKALSFTSVLHQKFPNNTIYQMRHAEALVFSGKYEEGLVQISQIQKNPDRVYQLTASVMNGIVAEKGKKNDKLATDFYTNALKITPDERYTKDYYAMAYAGLARIANRAGNKKRAKDLYEKCLDYAEYTSTVKEAKEYK